MKKQKRLSVFSCFTAFRAISLPRRPLLCLSMCFLLFGAEKGPVFAADYFISPEGDDRNKGTDPAQPMRTIQQGLKKAQAGDRIKLFPGVYWQDIRSVRSGELGRPIEINGMGKVIVKGAEKRRIIELNHSHIILSNFTVDGKTGDGSRIKDYKDKLVYVKGKTSETGVTGVKIIGMHFYNAGGECVRLKHFSRNNEVAHSTFKNCGVWDFKFNRGKKNGEVIYIGTAPEQVAAGMNPSKDVDESNDNWIHHNRIDSQGNECVDIKEGSSFNLIENNDCTGQQDIHGGAISVRGNHNTIRNNHVWKNKGAGIRLGGDTDKDGIGNMVYGNTLYDNGVTGIKMMVFPQGKICGNKILAGRGKKTKGPFKDAVLPEKPCE